MKFGLIEKFKAKVLKKKKVLVLGDSHTAIFSHNSLKQFFEPKYLLLVQTVGGATISDLSNPNSQTQALPIFTKSFETVDPDVTIIQLGEVDTGFLLWYQADKYEISINDMLQRCIENYKSFIRNCSGKLGAVVVSAPLPTIKDNQDWGDVATARKDVKSSQHERTELTLRFNQAVKKFCIEHSIHFIDLDPESVGENGLVSDKLLNADPNDHHYNTCYYSSLLKPHLAQIFYEE